MREVFSNTVVYGCFRKRWPVCSTNHVLSQAVLTILSRIFFVALPVATKKVYYSRVIPQILSFFSSVHILQESWLQLVSHIFGCFYINTLWPAFLLIYRLGVTSVKFCKSLDVRTPFWTGETPESVNGLWEDKILQ